jgi:hypothetical protein
VTHPFISKGEDPKVKRNENEALAEEAIIRALRSDDRTMNVLGAVAFYLREVLLTSADIATILTRKLATHGDGPPP